MKLQRKTVLITGASAGIGEACARTFAKAGARLILIARRRDRLIKLSEEFLRDYGTETFAMECDIRHNREIEKVLSSLPKEWKSIDILINNAGLARGLNKIQDGNISDWEEMIDTNIKGLLYVTRHVIPEMIKRGDGLIINIGSLAGHEVYPNGNVYCSTKFAVKALSKAMILDLNGTGVRVTNIDPGLVETEFSNVRFKGDKEKAKNVYHGYIPLKPEDIADIALFCATRPQHVMIQDLLVTPTDQASVFVLNNKS